MTPYTPILRRRLARLVALRDAHEAWSAYVDPRRTRLLDAAIVTTMHDLEDAGLSGVEIGRIVSAARAETGRRTL